MREKSQSRQSHLHVGRPVVLGGAGVLVGVALLPHWAGRPRPAVPLHGPRPALPGQRGRSVSVLAPVPPGDVPGRHHVRLQLTRQ